MTALFQVLPSLRLTFKVPFLSHHTGPGKQAAKWASLAALYFFLVYLFQTPWNLTHLLTAEEAELAGLAWTPNLLQAEYIEKA